MNRYKICILAIFIFSTSSLFSQVVLTEFSSDSVKFFEEMTSFLREADNKRGKDIKEEFEPIWFGGKFTQKQREGIYKTCNFMLKKKMNAYPEFSSYISSLIGFIKGNQNDDSFEAWQISIEKLIESKNKKKFEDYLNFSASFFEENAIYKSNTTKWVIDAKNFFFEFSDMPFIVVPATNLKCYSKGDSAIIHNTGGTYYPTLNKWDGKKGKVDWKRAGFEDTKVYAELKKYTVDTKGSDYEVDSVIFYNYFWFKKPLLGKLTEKVMANVTQENASYPQFDSYDKRLKIYNIINKVDYDGGYTQKGVRFIGSGSEKEDALLIFHKDGKPFIIASSKAYTIRPENIISNEAKVNIYLEDDSIAHPDLKLTLLTKERKLTLVRTEEGLSKTPFFNTYHKVEMNFEQIYWQIDEPTMKFGPLKGTVNSNALFESKDFFRQDKFDRLMGIDAVHPLTVIKMCSKKNNDATILTLQQVANQMKIAESQVKSLLLKLATLGFIEYDLSSDKITIKEKLNHFIFSNGKKEDYDVMQFLSNTSEGKDNASLNLLNYDIKMEGVERVILSDSQRVFVYPENQKLTLKKNRDFIFDGIVNAGGFEYFGKEHFYEYEKFKINMPNIDSARIYVNVGEKDEKGREIESRVRSTIENLKGELLIDNPGNKSGIKSIPRYPVFKSFEKSYVYYDAKSIFGGVYNRDKFYFQLKPFEFDSLDNFALKSISFEGLFASANIFPDFEEKLTLMSDLSLGFSRKTPEEGYPAYQGKGIYKNEINLSNRGLRGDGLLSYLTSTVESNDFIFFPDSMNTIAKNYEIEERSSGVEYPPVYGNEIKIHWEPYKDFMNASHTDKPIAMYDGTKFTGTLTNTPKGLSGNGMAAFQKAELESNLMKFKFIEFDADTAEFRLKSTEKENNSDVLSFASNNVKAHISFKDRKGEFIANGGGSFVEFPQNKYIAFMDKFTWFMEDEDIELSATTKVKDEQQGVQLEGSEFISTHPQQDSLRFYSAAARYDVKNHIITAKKVKYINVADALIYPDSEKVVIRKDAVIETLNNSKILANTTNKFHNIYNASINIAGRNKYTGSGSYDYLDENKKSQTIYLSHITVDSTIQTYGKGTVTQSDNFTISPNFEYKGDVILNASKKYLSFDGNTRVLHNCETIPKDWIRFYGEIDPLEVYIPIDTVIRNDQKNPAVASIMIKNDSAHVYPRFLSFPKKYSDIQMVDADGFLYYDKSSTSYKISNLGKLNEISLPGNFVSFNINSCNMYAEGKMSMGVDLGNVKLGPVGNVNYYTSQDSTEVNLMMWVDFFFLQNALDDMAKKIKKYEALDAVTFDRPVFERGLQEYVGKEQADKLISQLNLYGNFKRFPDELNKPIFFNDIKFRWNGKERSFQSYGKIGIGNIFKEELNKYVDGHIEIVKKRSGDIFTMYLQLDDNTWYFFSYTRDVMQVLSSDNAFNDLIKEAKADKKKQKYGKGKTYSFILSSPKKRADFMKRFKSDDDE